MRTALLLGVLAATAGCAACRPPRPLDDAERTELEATIGRLRTASVRVVVPPGDDGRDAIVDALHAMGFTAYRRVAEPAAGDVELRASRRHDAVEMNALDVWLPILTIGLWPWEFDSHLRYDLRFTRNGGASGAGSFVDERDTVFGWLAFPLSWSDDWRWGAARSEDDDAVRERLVLEVIRKVDSLVRGDTAH